MVTVRTETDKQLLSQFEARLKAAREVNTRVIDEALKGRDAEAMALFATAGAETMDKIDQATEDLLSWRQSQVEAARRRLKTLWQGCVR